MGHHQAQEGGHRRQARQGSSRRLIKNIEVAARTGGGDLAGNPTLFDAVQKAKKSSVPNDNIDRAVKRGSGEGADAVDYQTIMYEGYGTNGIAVLVECLTDNKNRAAAEVRTAFSRNGGSLADPGSVSYLFSRKGLVVVPKADGVTEDDVMLAALDAGAEDVTDSGDVIEVLCEASDLVAVRTAIQEAGIEYDSADSVWHPSMEVEVDAEGARKILRLIDALEDSDDVQNVYANFDASDEVMAELENDDCSRSTSGVVVGEPGGRGARGLPSAPSSLGRSRQARHDRAHPARPARSDQPPCEPAPSARRSRCAPRWMSQQVMKG